MREALLEINGLSKSFGAEKVLSDIQFTLNERERCLITGKNGSGKSTLFRCISGLEDPDNGSVKIQGIEISRYRRNGKLCELYRSGVIGYVFQDLTPWPHLTVLDNIRLPLKKMGHTPKAATEHSLHWMEMIDLLDKRDQFPAFLSGGQQRRLVLARALACRPKLLLLDEVTANLDTDSIQKILELLHKSGCALMIISHEQEHFRGIVDREMCLAEGKLEEFKFTLPAADTKSRHTDFLEVHSSEKSNNPASSGAGSFRIRNSSRLWR